MKPNSINKTDYISRHILGTRIDWTSYKDSTERIIKLVQNVGYGYVCVANVHVVMEAYHNPAFKQLINSADIATPDGMPLVWGLKMLGIKNAERVYGTKLTFHICEEAQKRDLPIGFFGGAKDVLELMIGNLKAKLPTLNVAYRFSPPFRNITKEEDEETIRKINNSGVKILFVGLGCPKQEIWMSEHKDKFAAVMIGVGAAFDFIAGTKPRAPTWMQNIGLEWFFRMMHEPQRLWKRYLLFNPQFIYLFGKQVLKEKCGISKL